ncbi:hypothetical protein SEA_LUNA18_22 [Microbacterium phage Luna18]|nr:hypothetical protein SEA_CHEPLI_22 [Microbacterium phage Chepli]QZE10310.1 hypothetical protein SEA_KATCHAN_22 [Microbacterium phage KatChan]URQ04873.1 hypothetical protein SEA_LUNA18_22 [Microbacterium phage Luna18]
MADTTAQHIATKNDSDLLERLIAAAEQAHVDNPEQFVRNNLGQIISTPIDEDGTTITTVHAYAVSQYQNALTALPPAPGLNPAAVTDPQLAQAIQAVWAPTPAQEA